MDYFYQAKVIPEMVFCHVTTGASPQEYLKNTFKHVMITRYEEYNHAEGVSEMLELAFVSQEKRVTPLNQYHRNSSSQSVGYDFAKMKSL